MLVMFVHTARDPEARAMRARQDDHASWPKLHAHTAQTEPFSPIASRPAGGSPA